MSIAAIDGKVALVLLAVLVTVALALRESRRAKHAEVATPAPTPAVITIAPRCATTGCGREGFWIATRRHTGQQDRVCTGCYDEGTVLGWWQ